MLDFLSCLNHICHFVLAGFGLSNENSSLHNPDRSIKDSPLRSPLAALWPREVAGYHEDFIMDEFALSVKEKGDLSFLKSCNSRGVYQKHSRILNKNLKNKDFWSRTFNAVSALKSVTVALLHFFGLKCVRRVKKQPFKKRFCISIFDTPHYFRNIATAQLFLNAGIVQKSLIEVFPAIHQPDSRNRR